MSNLNPQNQSVASYAGDLLIPRLASVAGNPVCAEIPMLDYEAFPTIRAVHDMHTALGAYIDECRLHADQGLPEGQPEGLKAFADRSATGFSQSRHVFSGQELKSVGIYGGCDTAAIITQDIDDEGQHICIAACPGERGLYTADSAESIIPLLLQKMDIKTRAPGAGLPRITKDLLEMLLKQGARPTWETVFFYWHKEPDNHLPEYLIRLKRRIMEGYHATGPGVMYKFIPTLLKLVSKPKPPSM